MPSTTKRVPPDPALLLEDDDDDGLPAATCHPGDKPTRRYSREIALRALYARELKGDSAGDLLTDTLVNAGQPTPDYAVRLIELVAAHQVQVDDWIRSRVEKWEFHRIALLDRLILRLAITEMLFVPDVPLKVALDEAIELTKFYSTDQSGRFVNGILDTLSKEAREGRLITSGGAA